MLWLWILVGIVVALLLYAVLTYNKLVRLRNESETGWANIDVQLRRRSDLVPNLVEAVKGYAAHESQTFEEVTEARAAAQQAAGPAAAAQADAELAPALNRLLAVSEAYPELRASENFLALQQELANTEDRLQTSRRFYNANVRDYNQRVKQFPSVIIASAFNFEEEEFFEVEDSLREAGAPQVAFGGEGPGVTFGGPEIPPVAPPPAPAAEPSGTPPPPPGTPDA